MASKIDMSSTSYHACQSAIRSAKITQSSRNFNSTIAFTSIVYFRMDFNKSDMSSMHDDGHEIPKHALQATKPHVAKAAKLKICLKCLNSQTSIAGITCCSFHPSWHCAKHEHGIVPNMSKCC
ncbi:hypothetical protein AMTRI_Chr02g266750 [Amborella trichopoda]